MVTGTKIRNLARLLDASPAQLWVISPAGRLIYLSAGVSSWLGIDGASLLDRQSIAGSPISDDPLDYVAASLSPPPGFTDRGTASLRIAPPPIEGRKIPALDVRFVRLGDGDAALTLAMSGRFLDQHQSAELSAAVAVRRQLDQWRRRHTAIATVATAGVSPAARRLRARLHVAAATRTHIGFFGPAGCGAESIAARIHQRSAPGEPLVVIDGPLMDAELLDASATPLINHLASSSHAQATALIRGLDEMPGDAGQRLNELLTTFAGRLRLLALCGPQPRLLAEPIPDQTDHLETLTADQVGIYPPLVDYLSALTVTIEPLSQRVEDIPILAAAILDARHAAGEGTAERLSRAALDALVMYPWPGNYSELDDAIRQAIRIAPQQSISAEHLPLAIRSYHVGEVTSRATRPQLSLDEILKRMELRLINEALEQANHNRAEAARRLGISRARLLRRLEEQDPSEAPS